MKLEVEFLNKQLLILMICGDKPWDADYAHNVGESYGVFDSHLRYFDLVHWHSLNFYIDLRGGAVVARYAHNVEVAGSIPAPANFGLSYKALINFV